MQWQAQGYMETYHMLKSRLGRKRGALCRSFGHSAASWFGYSCAVQQLQHCFRGLIFGLGLHLPLDEKNHVLGEVW